MTSRACRAPAVAAVVALLSVTACGDDETTDSTTSSSAVTTVAPTSVAPTSVAPTTVAPSTAAPTTMGPTTQPATTVPVGLEQPAIWPAADVVFTTPEEAAADFVSKVLQVPVVLSEFAAGDSRSGEFELWFEENGNPIDSSRGLLLMRKLGPASGWFVLGVANDFATISVPEFGATVPAGPLTVEGTFIGFEASGTIYAYVAGDAGRLLDSQQTMAGSMGVPGPYSVTLDLSGAEPGSTVMLVVRGGVGLETDPGEVGAIPVIIAG